MNYENSLAVVQRMGHRKVRELQATRWEMTSSSDGGVTVDVERRGWREIGRAHV